MKVTSITIHRIANGRLVEKWAEKHDGALTADRRAPADGNGALTHDRQPGAVGDSRTWANFTTRTMIVTRFPTLRTCGAIPEAHRAACRLPIAQWSRPCVLGKNWSKVSPILPRRL